MRAILERDLNDRLPSRHSLLQLLVWQKHDLGSFFENCGIPHSTSIMNGVKRNRLVYQHHGSHVLKTDVRYLTVVPHRGLACRHSYNNPLNLLCLDVLSFDEYFESVQRSLDRRSHSPLLYIRSCNFIPLSQLVDQLSWI